MNPRCTDPAEQPQLTKTPTRWERYLLAIVLIIAVPYPLALVMANFGVWIGLVLTIVFGVGCAVHELRTKRLILREVRARLMDREPVEVERQVADLVRAGVVPDERRVRVVQTWLDAGSILELDPTRLRWEDCIWTDYRSPLRNKRPKEVDWLVENLMFLANGSSTFRMIDSADPAQERCVKCRYDNTGLAQAARCPECGTGSFTIQTLGDVLLVSAGMFGGIDLSRRLDGRPVTSS